MKPTKKKTVACPAALRLEAMLPVDAGILSQQADDWTDRSVERGTVGPLAAEHALWHNCLFRNVTFTDCRLHSAQLSDIRFEGCDLSNLALDGAALNRVEFVGNAIFIPFFLLSVGMLIDYRAFFTSFEMIKVGAVMIVVATAAKFIAAWLTQKTFRMSVDQRRVIFGLSNAQAAAALAATRPTASRSGC